jgi:hypothetical protein
MADKKKIVRAFLEREARSPIDQMAKEFARMIADRAKREKVNPRVVVEAILSRMR